MNVTEESDAFYAYFYGLFTVIACVNIPGNLLIITTILRHERLKEHCNYYLVNQAVVDILLGIFYPLYNFAH